MLTDILEQPEVRVGSAMMILLIAAGFGLFLVSRLRDYTTQDRDEPIEMLSNFEEMHLKGDISSEEFRTITTATQSQVGDGPSIQSDDDQAETDSPPNSGESDAE